MSESKSQQESRHAGLSRNFRHATQPLDHDVYERLTQYKGPMMLRSLLRPCHIKLSTRCWHKHGKHAWLRTHCQPPRVDARSCKLHFKSRGGRIATRCAVADPPVSTADELPEVTDQYMSWRGRSIGCGDLNESHVGQRVTVCGWVHRHRGLGGVVFCDVRDSSGLLQVFNCSPIKSNIHPVLFIQLYVRDRS